MLLRTQTCSVKEKGVTGEIKIKRSKTSCTCPRHLEVGFCMKFTKVLLHSNEFYLYSSSARTFYRFLKEINI